MVGITQNKEVSYFQCSPLENEKSMKSKSGLVKRFKDSKTACK